MVDGKYVVLLIEDNKDFARLLNEYLKRFDPNRFTVIWKKHYTEALAEVKENNDIDIILMDYFLPGMNGIEITRELIDRKVDIPIVFLTINKDFDVVLRAMKLNVADYIIKEDLSSPILPTTIINTVERHNLQKSLIQREVSRQRLMEIHDVLGSILVDLERPIQQMQEIVEVLRPRFKGEQPQNYIKIIEDNINRLQEKIYKLKTLKEDKTVKYIKDIKMLDLSS